MGMNLEDLLSMLQSGVPAPTKSGSKAARVAAIAKLMPEIKFDLDTVNEETKKLFVRIAEQTKQLAEHATTLTQVFKDHADRRKPEGAAVSDALEKFYDALDAVELGIGDFDVLVKKYHNATCSTCSTDSTEEKTTKNTTETFQKFLAPALTSGKTDEAPAFADEDDSDEKKV